MTLQKITIFIILLCNNPLVILANYNVSHRINKEIRALNSNTNIGIKIRNLKTNEILYQQNSDRYYTFASGLKIITLFSLLKYFGQNYLFESKLLKKQQDYYLDINDPDFSTNDLEVLISKLKSKGTKNIWGNFYIIDNQFSVPAQAGGRMIEDSYYCYGAPITRIHINKNCIKLKVHANSQNTMPICLQNNEFIPYTIINKAFTVSDKNNSRIKTMINADELVISGTLSRSVGNIVINTVTNDSIRHIGNTVKRVLQKYNIILRGQILSSKPIKELNLAANVDKSINDIIGNALKMSDNFITDYLLAELGNRYGKSDWDDCGGLLKQLVLQEFKVDLSKATIVDGSGLSRHNMFTVDQFDKFLSALYRDSNFDDLIQMLAKPNEKSTLKKRFKNVKIFAKTGSLKGVSSLVGYIFDKDNAPFSFVIVANNYLELKKEYAMFEENIIRHIVSD